MAGRSTAGRRRGPPPFALFQSAAAVRRPRRAGAQEGVAHGTRELVFEPLDFLERLAAMTPRPETNLLVCHGVLAPRAQWHHGRMLAREARNVEAIIHLGAVLYQERRVDEALAKVEESLRIDPGYIRTETGRSTSSTASGIFPQGDGQGGGGVPAASAQWAGRRQRAPADSGGACAGRQAWPSSGRRRLRRGVPNCGVGASPRRSFVRLRTE